MLQGFEGVKVVRPKCRLPSALAGFLVLISFRGQTDLWSLVWPEGLWKWKTSMTLSGIEPATLRLIAQCLNQLHHCIPPIQRVRGPLSLCIKLLGLEAKHLPRCNAEVKECKHTSTPNLPSWRSQAQLHLPCFYPHKTEQMLHVVVDINTKSTQKRKLLTVIRLFHFPRQDFLPHPHNQSQQHSSHHIIMTFTTITKQAKPIATSYLSLECKQ